MKYKNKQEEFKYDLMPTFTSEPLFSLERERKRENNNQSYRI